MHKNIVQFGPGDRQLHPKFGHATLVALDVIVEALKPALPDVRYVVRRVRTNKTPIEDGDARFPNWNECAFDVGGPFGKFLSPVTHEKQPPYEMRLPEAGSSN